MTISQTQTYMDLIRKGVPAADAFKQAYPNGLPTTEDRAKAASKAQQANGLASIGGTVGGVITAKGLSDAIAGRGWFGPGKTPTINPTSSSMGPAFSGQGVNGIPLSSPTGASPGGIPLANAPGETVAPQFPGGEAAPGLLSQAPGTTLMGSETAGAFLPAAGIAAGAYTGLQQGKGLAAAMQGKKLDFKQQAALALPTMGLSLVSNYIPGFTHQSTRDLAREHTGQLASQGKGDAAWQSYVTGMRNQYNAAPPDPSKPFAGKYSSWDEYKKAGLDSNDLTGVYGNLKTFGPDWAHLSLDQQKAVTQGLINNNLYDSKKGEVVITDPTKAIAVKNAILAGGTPKTTQAPQQSSTVNPKLALALNSQNNTAALNLAQQQLKG